MFLVSFFQFTAIAQNSVLPPSNADYAIPNVIDPSSIQYYHRSNTNLFISGAFAALCPRIYAPNLWYNTFQAPIPFVMTHSNSPFSNTPNNNLYYWYWHPISLSSLDFLDGQNNYGFSYNGDPAIDYTQSNLNNRDAVVAWPSIITPNSNPTNQERGIYAINQPAFNQNFYNWEQVNLTPKTYMGMRYCVSVAAATDNNMNEYVIAWEDNGAMFYKWRAFNLTNFKIPKKTVPLSLTLFPNPATYKLFLRGAKQQDYKIYNSLGAELLQGKSSMDIETIPVSSLAIGTYYLHCNNQVFPFVISK